MNQVAFGFTEMREVAGNCGQGGFKGVLHLLSIDSRCFGMREDADDLAEGCRGDCGGRQRGKEQIVIIN